MNRNIDDREESRPHNSTYPKGEVSCSEDTFVQAESSVLRMKFSGKSPALLVAAKPSNCLKSQITNKKSIFKP